MDKKIRKDVKILAEFVRIYCRDHHHDQREIGTLKGDVGDLLNPLHLVLCIDCKRILMHGAAKRILCPYDPKPMCKKCPIPCYRPGHREAIREMMRYSGIKSIQHGRLDRLIHYFF